jgi:hypothetical protein
MELLFKQLENKIPFMESINPKISAVSAGWHIDHSLKVIITVCKSILKSDGNHYQWKLNWKRSFVFFINKIPRGAGKAPKSVQSPEQIVKEDLWDQLNEGKKQFEKLKELQATQYIQHPVFGNLNAKQTKKFLELHTAHHLKIINEILKKK